MGEGLNRQSREMTEGAARTPNRAMLRAIGFEDEDFRKPIVGLASAGAEVSPCNVHHDELAAVAKQALKGFGCAPLKFNTFVVTDGMAMGHEGMKCSLVSRDVIADTIELVVRGHRMDAIFGIGGCDKTIPGTLMPMARLNLPSIFVYGGTILPGEYRGKAVDIVSAFEAVGAFSKGLIDEEERYGIECNACPGPGACGGMYTANTMAAAAEAIGMSLPGSASIPAVDSRKRRDLEDAARALGRLIRDSVLPRDIMSRAAFENAIRVVMAVGGSTNAVLHLLALAREAEVDLITDGRFSGGSHGMVVGHVAPEAQEGGAIALLRDGDRITIDSRKKLLSVQLSGQELERRKAAWKAPAISYQSGALAKYARLVSSASRGAVTH